MLGLFRSLLGFLIQLRHDSLNFVVWRDSDPDHPKSFRFTPIWFVALYLITLGFGVGVIGTILYVTPLGDRIYNREDEAIREEIVALGGRLLALQDTIDMRDAQLDNIKQVLYDASDTTIVLPSALEKVPSIPVGAAEPVPASPAQGGVRTETSALTFPIRYPVDGVLSRPYEPANGHFGVDLSAPVGTPFYAVADGVLMSAEFTLAYGTIIHVQHGQGFVSVYKHADRSAREAGYRVRRGDLLGYVSDSGIVSTGPHIHIELWKDGTPLDPRAYFINR